MLTISIFTSLQDGNSNDETVYEPLSIVNTLWSNTVLATGILPLSFIKCFYIDLYRLCDGSGHLYWP